MKEVVEGKTVSACLAECCVETVIKYCQDHTSPTSVATLGFSPLVRSKTRSYTKYEQTCVYAHMMCLDVTTQNMRE